jgi:hypothetical protein
MDKNKCPKSVLGLQNFYQLFQKTGCEHYALTDKKALKKMTAYFFSLKPERTFS